MLAPLLVTVALLIALAGMVLIILFNTQRVLAGVDRHAWARTGYRGQAPNLLTLLARAQMDQPWPRRLSGLTVIRFRRRLRKLIRQEPSCTLHLIERHIGFWVHVQERLPLVDYALSVETGALLQRVSQAVSSSDRLTYLKEADELRVRQVKLRSELPRQFGDKWSSDAAALYVVLKTLQIVFAEHGFNVHPGFQRIRQLEEALEPVHPSAG